MNGPSPRGVLGVLLEAREEDDVRRSRRVVGLGASVRAAGSFFSEAREEGEEEEGEDDDEEVLT